MRTIKNKLVSIEYSDFTRKLLHKKGIQFSEKNIGKTWFSDEVIEFRYVADAFEELEITIAQTQYEQEERNKPPVSVLKMSVCFNECFIPSTKRIKL